MVCRSKLGGDDTEQRLPGQRQTILVDVTITYLRGLEGQDDKGWGKVAEAIGVAS